MATWEENSYPIETAQPNVAAWEINSQPFTIPQFPQLSQKQEIPQVQSDQSLGEQAAKQLGLTGRYLIEGPASMVTGVGDLANKGVNALTGAINNYTGSNIPQLGMPSQDLSNVLTKIGYPEPEGNTQKGVATAAKLATALMPSSPQLMKVGGEALSNLSDMMAKPEIPITSDAAKSIASQHYANADELGGIVSPDFTNKMIDAASEISPQSFAGKVLAGDNPITQINGKLQALKDKPLTLNDIQEMDETLGDMINKEYGLKGLSGDGKKLLDLQSSWRNMVQNASPDDLIGGSQGFDAWDNGRQAYAQAMKMKDIENIQTRASLSDNPATTIKSGVRTLLSNPARIRGYSDDEIEALKNAGDRGVVGGALHVLGNRLWPLVGTAVGEGSGVPGGAVLGAGIGHFGSSAFRNAATSIQAKKLGDVLKTMGSNINGQ